MQQEKVVFPSESKDEWIVLLDDLEIKGSPLLRTVMKKVRNDLDQGTILKDFGCAVGEDE